MQNAIEAFSAYLIDRFAGAGLFAVFSMADAHELCGECCLRFGLFPPEFDSMQLKIPAWLASRSKRQPNSTGPTWTRCANSLRIC
jgi:hypothetical protein